MSSSDEQSHHHGAREDKHTDIGIPANTNILAYLKSLHPDMAMPDVALEVDSENARNLDVHPEVVSRVWNEITERLPEDCRRVVYRTPTLLHPETGVVFAFGSGVPTYALRLPSGIRSEAIRLGAKTKWTYNDAWLKGLGPEHNTTVDLTDVGPEWVFGKWLPQESDWCLAAYNLAGELT